MSVMQIREMIKNKILVSTQNIALATTAKDDSLIKFHTAQHDAYKELLSDIVKNGQSRPEESY